ncbi:GFA family protein [Sagittula sp. SSi028]|uniref:GFA family protein n=1 Tax=Sagittula sp. SSi028 TaxID=3400636 RepID=UPI003AF45D52
MSDLPSTPLTATCHCGAVALEVRLIDGPNAPRKCDCSYCRRRPAAVVSAPLDGVRVIKGADHLSEYTWGTHTARHYFCKTCGIYMYHRRRSNPNEFGVNLYCIDGMEPKAFEPVHWNDGVNHPSDT